MGEDDVYRALSIETPPFHRHRLHLFASGSTLSTTSNFSGRGLPHIMWEALAATWCTPVPEFLT